MSNTSLRSSMVTMATRTRAYFAPVDRTTDQPTIFDPAAGMFPLDSPPSPWIDLGWISNLKRTSRSSIDALRAGWYGTAVQGLRGVLNATIEFDFCEWGKLQMALASGGEHMNVLAADANSVRQPSGGSALAPVVLLPGSSAQELQVGAGAVSYFAPGDIVAVDLDYQQQVGYVGTGLAAAYVQDAQDVLRSPDYVRRVTFNAGRVANLTATSLLLAQPLLGGVPATGAAIQKVVAFVDREGGSFFQQWSALFVIEEAAGGRICLHYPRLNPVRDGTVANGDLERTMEIQSGLQAVTLHASFMALPHVDLNDNATALCYRSFFPATSAALY